MWLLENGNEVLDWLAETDWQRYASKIFKLIDRINESNLSLEDLPAWVDVHVLTVTK